MAKVKFHVYEQGNPATSIVIEEREVAHAFCREMNARLGYHAFVCYEVYQRYATIPGMPALWI